MAWCLAKAPRIVPISGTNRMDRLTENLGAATQRLTPEVMAELVAASAAIPTTGLRLPDAVLAVKGR